MTTGERIKELRTAKGVTQEELGRLIGVQRAAVYKYETGLIVNLKRDVIDKIATVFDVSPSFIMCLEDDAPEKDQLSELVEALNEDGLKELTKYGRYLTSIKEYTK